jgi:hypothetical protein
MRLRASDTSVALGGSLPTLAASADAASDLAACITSLRNDSIPSSRPESLSSHNACSSYFASLNSLISALR